MNLIKFSIQNSREGILTVQKDVFTCITDQNIQEGDVILHPQYSKVIGGGDVSTLVVRQIQEERPSRGVWKSTPSTFRSIKYERQKISGSELVKAGYLKIEQVTENGKPVQKAYLQL